MDKDKEKQVQHTCGETCEVYSRVCGYFRPVSNWNHGKKEEFKDRVMFNIQEPRCSCCK